MIRKTFIALSIIIFGCTSAVFGEYELEGYVKAAPLHKSTKEIMSTVQKLGIPAEQQILPYMFLGFLGYPEYPGLSREENVSLFIYSTPDYSSHQYVVMAKIDDSSPLLATFPQIGWSVKKYQDWTLLSQSKDILNSISNPDSLVRVTQRPIESDIEAGYLFKQSRKHLAAFEQKLKEQALNDDPISYDNVIVTLEVFMDILERCHGGSVGLNFNEDSIDLDFAIKANPNTPEAKILSQKPSQPYTIAKYLKRGNMLSAASSSNPELTKEYADFLLDEAIRKSNPENSKAFIELKKMAHTALSGYTGTCAGTVSITPEGTVAKNTLYSGNYSDQSVVSLMRDDFPKSVSSLVELFMPEQKLNYDVDFQESAITYKDTPLHLIRVRASKDEYKEFLEDAEILEATYFGSIDGNLLTSTDTNPFSVEALAKQIYEKEPVTGNVLETLPFKEDTYLQFELNLQAFLEHIIRDSMKDKPDQELAAALESLSKSKFKPIRGYGKMEDRTLKIHTNIPLGNINKIQAAFKQLRPSIETASDDDKEYKEDDEYDTDLDA